MKIVIYKNGDEFTADPDTPGQPPVGRGKTMEEALGNFLRAYQRELGVHITVHSSAWDDELKRREEELSKR